MAPGEDLKQRSMNRTRNALRTQLAVRPQVELTVEVVFEQQSDGGSSWVLVDAHTKAVTVMDHAGLQLGGAERQRRCEQLLNLSKSARLARAPRHRLLRWDLKFFGRC
jgi:hypothetical protein